MSEEQLQFPLEYVPTADLWGEIRKRFTSAVLLFETPEPEGDSGTFIGYMSDGMSPCHVFGLISFALRQHVAAMDEYEDDDDEDGDDEDGGEEVPDDYTPYDSRQI